MKHEIDLFGTRTWENDYRWDSRQNGELLSILFHGGTFGNFLKFFLEKFSRKTPEMNLNPFNENGNAHNIPKEVFSGLIQCYHSHFVNDNKEHKKLPVCLIMPNNKKDSLYLKKSQWYRAGDRKFSPNDLWQKPVGQISDSLVDAVENIKALYRLEISEESYIPKFIVRDWYKLEFLLPLPDQYNYQWYQKFKYLDFFKQQKFFEFGLEGFFDWTTFMTQLKELDTLFTLDLDFSRHEEMKLWFDKGYEVEGVRQECDLAEDIVNGAVMDNIPELDVSTEAFIYAELEKKHGFTQMPLTNHFFKSTKEIDDLVGHYPEHYKAMNPNLKRFNGYKNPFYLDKT